MFDVIDLINGCAADLADHLGDAVHSVNVGLAQKTATCIYG